MKRVEFTSQGIVLTKNDGSYEVYQNDRIHFFNKKGKCERVVLMDNGYVTGLSVDGGKSFMSAIDGRSIS
ncbi:hypothetical protein J1TS1_28260 [Shouchella clausii]|uniref:hypothetical protein n=1 Tax=Bacteria TaxID=2 RepID=UPI001B2402AA|nr:MULTISPECIES: hypothetical protein [Bacteria]GIN08681.1 hypothetical protein J1TS1_28260 [Shouchella clausii]